MTGTRSRTDGLLLGLILLLAAGLRVAAALDEPWLDELWSKRLALQAASVGAVFTAPELRIDNNHWLNTIYLRLLGDTSAWWPNRVPAISGGVATVLFAWLIARRWDRATAVVAATGIAIGFIFVQYGSEARGYGPAAGLATASIWLVVRFVGRRGSGVAAAVFGVVCVAGLLFHITFVYALAGAAAAVPVLAWQAGRRGGRLIGDISAWLAAPIVFGAGLYVFVVRGMQIGGGPRYGLGQVLGDVATFTTGVPAEPAIVFAAFAAMAIAAGYGVWRLAKSGRGEWVALAVAGWAAPALTLVVRPAGPLYARYFFVALPFVVLAVAAAVTAVWRRGPGGRVIAGVAVLAFVAGNGMHLQRFYDLGRGQNRQMVEFLVNTTPGPTVRLAAAQRFRLSTVLDYTLPRVDLHGKTVDFAVPDDEPPQWFVLDRDTDIGRPPPVLRVAPWPGGFSLAAIFPHYGLSGCEWVIYRRIDTPPLAEHTAH